MLNQAPVGTAASGAVARELVSVLGYAECGAVVVGGSVTGFLPAIVKGLGTLLISLSNTVQQGTGIQMTVSLTPADAVPSNGRLIVTLVGAGFACSANTAVTFVSPPDGAGSVSISGGLVLTLQLSGGTFNAGSAVVFWFGGVLIATDCH